MVPICIILVVNLGIIGCVINLPPFLRLIPVMKASFVEFMFFLEKTFLNFSRGFLILAESKNWNESFKNFCCNLLAIIPKAFAEILLSKVGWKSLVKSRLIGLLNFLLKKKIKDFKII